MTVIFKSSFYHLFYILGLPPTLRKDYPEAWTSCHHTCFLLHCSNIHSNLFFLTWSLNFSLILGFSSAIMPIKPYSVSIKAFLFYSASIGCLHSLQNITTGSF